MPVSENFWVFKLAAVHWGVEGGRSEGGLAGECRMNGYLWTSYSTFHGENFFPVVGMMRSI